MPTLITGTGDLVLEDIIDIASDDKTRVIDDERALNTLRSRNADLKYCYVVEVSELNK